MTTLALHRSHEFSGSASKLSYLQYEPPGWSTEPRPLVLFLHGGGERGSNLPLVARHGIPHEIERGKNFPFIAVSPQCPRAATWIDLAPVLRELLDHLVPRVRADPRRIYLTGISMGAFGAWKLAASAPALFAALVPICGGGDPAWAQILRDLPTWAFHGEDDDVVSVRHTQTMVDALQTIGAPIKLTLYPGIGHECWAQTYENPELYDWLLGQRRSAEQSGHHAAEHRARI